MMTAITINVPDNVRIASIAIADSSHPGMLSEIEWPSDQLRVVEVRIEPRRPGGWDEEKG